MPLDLFGGRRLSEHVFRGRHGEHLVLHGRHLRSGEWYLPERW
jgi:hypothetical protein